MSGVLVRNDGGVYRTLFDAKLLEIREENVGLASNVEQNALAVEIHQRAETPITLEIRTHRSVIVNDCYLLLRCGRKHGSAHPDNQPHSNHITIVRNPATLAAMTRPRLKDVAWLFFRVGNTTFGGGNPTIAV